MKVKGKYVEIADKAMHKINGSHEASLVKAKFESFKKLARNNLRKVHLTNDERAATVPKWIWGKAGRGCKYLWIRNVQAGKMELVSR